MWQSSLTFFYGARAAKRLGDAHEWGETCTRSKCDTGKDQHNNWIARQFASNSWNSYMMWRWYLRGTLFINLFYVGAYYYRRGWLAR